MRIRKTLASFLFLVAAVPAGGALASSSETAFPRSSSLVPAVDFWKDIFTQWDADEIVYHDGRDLSRVYEVHRLPPADGTYRREREREALRAGWKEALERDLDLLGRADAVYDSLDGRLYRLYAIWDQSRDPAVYRAAAENIRSQRGIRERFLGGVARSARYMDRFREIFREEGVPEDLVYLPHVESSYQWNAQSGVGAAGMWQFMSGTARRFDMMVNEAVDERLDPYTAARAAARYLKAAHDQLGTWPLAITSYNHGVDGVKNAVRETGSTDISRIIDDYQGPLFGFAGRNFYPEFLAARESADSLLADPGDLALDQPWAYDLFVLPAYVKLPVLARSLGVNPSDLAGLNPALRPPTREGRAYLPKGFALKVPAGLGGDAPGLFASLPAAERPLTEPVHTYRVRHGDSLGGIASRFHTTVRALAEMNGLRNPNRLRVGANLLLPH